MCKTWKIILPLLLALCFTDVRTVRAANYPFQTNAIIEEYADSLEIDGSSTSPQTGMRHWVYLYNALNNYYPNHHLKFGGIFRSGGKINDEFWYNMGGAGVSFFGQTNNVQYVGLLYAGDAGSLSSNGMFLAISNFFQAPLWTTNGTTANEQQSGWCATNHIEWIAFGPPPADITGGAFQKLHNDAVTNAGPLFGVMGIDVLNPLYLSWSNQYHLDNGAANLNVIQSPDPKVGHYLSGASLSWAFPILRRLITDSNVSTSIIDWTNATEVSSYHCAISSISRSGNSLTFNRADDRYAMGYDVPGVNVWGDTITNDCRGAWVTKPDDADFFQFTQGLTNCPAGTYEIYHNGVLVWTVTDTQLTRPNGLNFFTNNVGPYWDIRCKSIHPIRTYALCDQTTLISGSAGAGEGMVSYLSNVGSHFPAHRGDALIADMASKNTQIQTNFVPIWSAPTTQTIGWEIRLVGGPPPLTSPGIVLSAATNALNVPVIVDASTNLSITTYLWSQTNGTPQLDMIGMGTPKLMLIGVTNAGSYTFQLITSDGLTYGTNAATVTFIQPSGRTNYVDSTLTANIVNGTYSIASRNNSGSAGNAYTNLQFAANTTIAGDLLLVRGGIYSNTPAVGNQVLCTVTNHGTAIAPIRFVAYPGETPVLSGWGFSDVDGNADGLADGPTYPLWRQTLFFIPTNADYIQVQGLEMTNCQQSAMSIQGNFCYVSDCSAHDNWFVGIAISHAEHTSLTQRGNVVQRCEAYQNRHFTGIMMGLEDQNTFAFMTDCAIVDCISYRNGYTPTAHVLPIGGDPQGGGNADGISATKYFADDATFFPQYGVINWGTNLYFMRSICYSNSDDGFDTSIANSLIEDNRSLFNGPTGTMGYKMFRPGANMRFRGNIAYGNQGRGFEMRYPSNSTIRVFNNTSAFNVQYGFWGLGTTNSGSIAYTTNNVAAFNGNADWPNSEVPNWGEDGVNVPTAYRGDPKFANTNLTLPTTFTAGWTVRQKHDYLEGLIEAALTPATNSPLLRKALFVPGYHCPTADDDAVNPMSLTAPGRHWLTNSPDLGALSVLSTNIIIPTPPALVRFGVYR
jgi:hypothetical protein